MGDLGSGSMGSVGSDVNVQDATRGGISKVGQQIAGQKRKRGVELSGLVESDDSASVNGQLGGGLIGGVDPDGSKKEANVGIDVLNLAAVEETGENDLISGVGDSLELAPVLDELDAMSSNGVCTFVDQEEDDGDEVTSEAKV